MARDFAQCLLGVWVIWCFRVLQDVNGCSEFVAKSLTALPHTKQMITSMNYPSFYPDNDNRCWKIKVSLPGYVVNLETSDFRVEIMLGIPCGSADYLEIRDGYSDTSPLLKKMCGTEHVNLTSTGDSMYLRFKSDESVSQEGFLLTYQAIPNSESNGPVDNNPKDGCRDLTRLVALESIDSHLQSPNFPNAYPELIDRCWLIAAYDRDMVVRIKIVESSLEDTYSCESGDFVEATDGTELTDKRLAMFCGDTFPSVFTSSGPNLLLRFHTDQTSNSFSGFHLKYTMVEPNSGNENPLLSIDQTMKVLIGVGVVVIALAVIFAVIGLYKKSGHTHVHVANDRRESRHQQQEDPVVRLAFESILNQPMSNMRVTQANLRAPAPYEGPQRPPSHLGFVAPTQPGYSPWMVPSSNNKRHRNRNHRNRGQSLTIPATIRQYHDTMYPPGTPVPPEAPPYDDIIKALDEADWGIDRTDNDTTEGKKEINKQITPPPLTVTDLTTPEPTAPPVDGHGHEEQKTVTQAAIPGAVDGGS